jgi:hypothetical protein
MIHRMKFLARSTVIASLIMTAWPAATGANAENQPGIPTVQITEVTNLPIRDTAKIVIQVKWTATFTPQVTVDHFNATVQVTYPDGTKDTAGTSVGASERSANISLPKRATAPQSFAANVVIFFKGNLSVTSTGNF